jgi:hypothetical protein
VTGTVWGAEINGWGFSVNREISANKALYGFLTDLGLEGYTYLRSYTVETAGDYEEMGRQHRLESVPLSQVFSTMHIVSAPYIGEEGEPIDDWVRITLQLGLTTKEYQNNGE